MLNSIIAGRRVFDQGCHMPEFSPFLLARWESPGD